MDPAAHGWHTGSAVHRPVDPIQEDVPCRIGTAVEAATPDKGGTGMKSEGMRTIAIVTALVSALVSGPVSAQDKYSLKVPGGLAFSEFKGYENWQLVSISRDGPLIAAILAN